MSDADAWQRLDVYLWHARVLRSRTGCTALVAAGSIRINRIATTKPHAKIRAGDVLTLIFRNEVKVWRVRGFTLRRSSPAAAAATYDEIAEPPSCNVEGSSAYPPSSNAPERPQ